MRIKPALIKKAVPVLNSYGFSLKIPGRSHYIFLKEDGSQSISITTARFNPKMLKVRYHMYCESPFSLELGSLNADFCPASAMGYSSQEELELYIEEVVKESIDIVLPFLHVMENNRVFSSNELSRELSVETAERVNCACNKWNLTQTPSLESLKMIDIILAGMRTDTAHRKEDFYKNKRDMVNLTAYFGELLAKSEGLPGRWIWRELHEGSPRFVIEAHSYDPLERLIAAWNFGQESFVYSIGRFPIATPSEDEEDKGPVHPS